MTTDPLSGYRDNPLINKQWNPDADHDIESMREAYTAWTLGINIAHNISGKDTSLRFILERAAEESAMAVMEMIECDMSTPVGVDNARALQSRAIRYREMIEWLCEAMAIGTEAADVLEEDQAEKLSEGLGLGTTGEADVGQ